MHARMQGTHARMRTGEDSLNAFMYQNRMGTTGKLSVTAALRGGPSRHMR